MPHLYQKKSSFRKSSLNLIGQLTDQEKISATMALHEQFFKCIDISSMECFAMYAEDQTEISVRTICQSLLEKNKSICFPKVKGNSMEFFMVKNLDDLQTGRFGLLEPIELQTASKRIDVMLIPGRAFDQNGVRIGRGAGYYDRYLENHAVKNLLGIGYDFQVYTHLPSHEHDVRMHAILTDKNCYTVKERDE